MTITSLSTIVQLPQRRLQDIYLTFDYRTITSHSIIGKLCHRLLQGILPYCRLQDNYLNAICEPNV
jgi:hypothetical protein